MSPRVIAASAAAAALALTAVAAGAQRDDDHWTFVVSGDSRNCGDIVMPAIAKTAADHHAEFFWHLGDLRAITIVDNDIANQPEHRAQQVALDAYLAMAWPDFIESQIKPFGDIPFVVGIGNHDVAPGKSRDAFTRTFAPWLDQPMLRAQRLADGHDTSVKPYIHWRIRGVAFVYLDNASIEQLDSTQLAWAERVIAADAADPSVTTLVVGMHKPLPDSFAGSHSMDESPTGVETGRKIMAALQKAQNDAHKKVYTLASHQHFYMADYLSNDYWRSHGGRVPGWVIGTAGAPRYPLPVVVPKVAKTNVYGSLVAKVSKSGEIDFDFREVEEKDVPEAVVSRYGAEFVHWCMVNNTVVRTVR